MTNPHSIRDGEMLPCVGGPLDGTVQRVSILLPFLNGGFPSAGMIVGTHRYHLDAANREWVYVGTNAEVKGTPAMKSNRFDKLLHELTHIEINVMSKEKTPDDDEFLSLIEVVVDLTILMKEKFDGMTERRDPKGTP